MSSVSLGPWESSGPVRSRKAADVASVETMVHESRGTRGNVETTMKRRSKQSEGTYLLKKPF